MLTIKQILTKLTEAVNGTDYIFYETIYLRNFAERHQAEWNKDTSGNEIADTFVDDMRDTDKECRRCSVCGELMIEGCYDGQKYFCSMKCLHTQYTDEEWEQECEQNDDCYFTHWR